MTKFQEYRKDRQEILYHPVKVTDEGIRLMVTVIDQMEAAMRRFINFELPDCMAREEMKSLLDGPPVPGPEHITSGEECWCRPDKIGKEPPK